MEVVRSGGARLPCLGGLAMTPAKLGAMTFDPVAKAQQLVDESTSWDTSVTVDAEPGDIPLVDVTTYFATGERVDLDAVAAVVREACETVGFFQLTGHGVPRSLIEATFAETRRLHALPADATDAIRLDRPDFPLRGVGYMPVGERKLPIRAHGNVNEAFVIKTDRDIGFDDNQWPDEHVIPGFRDAVERYAGAVEALAMRLLPIYAVALDMEPDFFDEGFTDPFWRLRMTHYPPVDRDLENDGDLGDYGIPPHVDTTFCTLLLQDSPGLTIYSTPRDAWVNAAVVDDAYVVNTGELLRQWTNDRFLSVRHFANNHGQDASRYSIPFFFNANADYPMACVPSCCGPDNPAKYPPVSYLQSQAVVQGE